MFTYYLAFYLYIYLSICPKFTEWLQKEEEKEEEEEEEKNVDFLSQNYRLK